MPLDQVVRLIAREAGLHERKKKPLAEVQPPGRVEIHAHAFSANHESSHEPGEPLEHVVHGQKRVREHDALSRGVRDVALVPEGDILETDERIAPHHPRQAADPLGDDRVSLVRHRGGPLLAHSEGLLDLAHLGPRQVPDFERKTLERRRDRRKRREELRMAISLDDLRGARRRLEPERFARQPLDLGRCRCVGSDRPRELADPHPVERSRESSAIAVELKRPAGELEAERRRLRVHSVRSSDRQCVLELEGTLGDHRECFVERPHDQRACIAHRERERRIEHIRGGEAEVNPTPVRSDLFGERVHERGDIVIRRLLELRNALDARNSNLRPNRFYRTRWHGAELAPRVEHRELHQQPAFELGLLRPDARHFRSGVACDHCCDSRGRARTRRCTLGTMRSPLVRVFWLGSKWEEARGGPSHRGSDRRHLRSVKL